MDGDAGGWMWLLIDVGLVAVLGAALIYGIVQWRNQPKRPAVQERRDQATRRLYDKPDQSPSR
ncbi:MAG: hypothetical protein K2Y27_34425 [Xanthobacteraceae bacterium]|nr:hypothetical protein [Xanthobacteraceae bacterium]